MIDVSSKLGADNVVDLSSKTSNNSFSHCEILARHIWLEFMIMKLTAVLLVFWQHLLQFHYVYHRVSSTNIMFIVISLLLVGLKR